MVFCGNIYLKLKKWMDIFPAMIYYIIVEKLIIRLNQTACIANYIQRIISNFDYEVCF